MGRLRTAAKWGAWLLGACALVLAAWFGINATDQELSAEARDLLEIPPLPAPSRDNGFLDLLALGAPEDVPAFEAGLERLSAYQNQRGGEPPPPSWGEFKFDSRVPRCALGAASRDASGQLPCLAAAAAEPRLRELIDGYRTLLRRYQAMRERPNFRNLIAWGAPHDSRPSFHEMLSAQRLVLFEAALRFNAGDREGALRELEHDAAFYRRMSADATALIDKFVAFAAQDRIALFAAELARRMPSGEAPLWRRLESLLGPLTKEELDALPSLRRANAETVRWMQARSYLRVSDAVWEGMAYSGKTRPWWDPVAPYLYRPHQTANWFAAQCRIFLPVGERPSTQFFAAAKAAREQARAIDPGPVASVIYNPAGWRHPVIDRCDDYNTVYIARMHGRAGVQTLARLIVKLRAGGISRPEDVAAALAGPLGQAHPDPFTGKPMRFDPSSGTVGFDILTAHVSGVAHELRKRYGRMALPL